MKIAPETCSDFTNLKSGSLEDKATVLMLLSNPATYDIRPLKEAESLCQNGHKVIILAWNREGVSPRQPFSTRLITKRFNLRAPYGQSIGTLLGFSLFYIWCFFNASTIGFQVIHCHDIDTLPCGILLKFFRGGHVKLVYDMHDHPLIFLNSFPRSKSLVDLMFSFMRKYADHLIVVNDGFIEYLALEGFKKENITVIMNVPERIADRPPLRENNVFRIFYYGELGKDRGVHNLIKAVEPLSNVLLLLAGRGDFVPWIIQLEKAHPNISYLGWISNSEIERLIRTCHLIPTLYLPNNINQILATPGKFFTSITNGIPVLASEGTYMATLVREYKCGMIVDATNPISIREAIEALIVDKSLFERLARNGIKAARGLFNWSIMEKRLLSTYSNLLRIK